MYDLVTFGEAMIRLTSPEFMRLENTTSLSITAGGAEMNVASMPHNSDYGQRGYHGLWITGRVATSAIKGANSAWICPTSSG